jgi:hypothetical protein
MTGATSTAESAAESTMPPFATKASVRKLGVDIGRRIAARASR